MEEITKGITGDDSFSLASGVRKLKEMTGRERPCVIDMKAFAKKKPRNPARSGSSIQAFPMVEHKGVHCCIKACISCAIEVFCS